jgi:hypothetical protein
MEDEANHDELNPDDVEAYVEADFNQRSADELRNTIGT